MDALAIMSIMSSFIGLQYLLLYQPLLPLVVLFMERTDVNLECSICNCVKNCDVWFLKDTS